MRRFDTDQQPERAAVACRCGSGFPGRTLCDADDIVCVMVCDACEPATRQRFRPDCLGGPIAWTADNIEPS